MPLDKDLVIDFLSRVESDIVAAILRHTGRLERCSKLLRGYEEARDAWKEGRTAYLRDVTSRVNELCVAKAMLEDVTVSRVEYESPLAGTAKTIDFLAFPANKPGVCLYYDVRTVQPEERDSWAKYLGAVFTPGTNLILEREWMGGEIFHEKVTARARFVEHTLELEEKIRGVSVSQKDRTFFRLILCGDGFQWHRSELEDFVETYFRGSYPWDHFAAMQEHYLKSRGREFERTVHGFCYLKRRQPRTNIDAFVCDVRGPDPGLVGK